MPLSGEPRTLAVNPFIMRDNKKQDVPFWGIMLLKMWAGYRKLIGCVTTDWINNWGWIPSCATVPSTLLLVWHQFALISNSILLFSLFQQWGVCSIFPAAQSGAIYQHADTSKANPLRPKKKKEQGEPCGYLPQQIICFGSKKKVAKTEGHCLRISFHLNTVSLLCASVFDKIWMYLVLFHSLSGNIMVIFCKRSLRKRAALLRGSFLPFNLSGISQRRLHHLNLR